MEGARGVYNLFFLSDFLVLCKRIRSEILVRDLSCYVIGSLISLGALRPVPASLILL